MKRLALILAVVAVAAAVAFFAYGERKIPGADTFRTATERLESPIIAPGESWNMTFVHAEDIPYECHPHPWMKGHLVVLESDGAPRTWNLTIHENAEGWGFEPASLTVRAGDTVTWTNVGETTHTATRKSGEHEHT